MARFDRANPHQYVKKKITGLQYYPDTIGIEFDYLEAGDGQPAEPLSLAEVIGSGLPALSIRSWNGGTVANLSNTSLVGGNVGNRFNLLFFRIESSAQSLMAELLIKAYNELIDVDLIIGSTDYDIVNGNTLYLFQTLDSIVPYQSGKYWQTGLWRVNISK